ncbi:hypothetical protein Sste5346_003131 [Sporothrix stenoceras]|uniref:Vacuolar protein sorting-associated protein 51 homolog n=1 Tax=Sporothrix stenoceras TaxID=5173 RepID=A0ABR3ZI46_9PEZI
MSTIASPREPPMRRMPSSSQTPTSSSRPSLETSRRSLSSSPSRNPAASAAGGSAAAGAGTSTAGGAPGGAARRNRAALREYYNLKKTGGGNTPVLEVTEFDSSNGTDALHAGILSNSEVPPSEMDAPNFDPDAYVQKTLQESGLEDLLKIYTRVLTETRALDAEKKSLVYDNYSRLITATETIRKMRATMDPLNPMASTLDPAIAHIYNQAKTLRDAMRENVPPPSSDDDDKTSAAARARNQKLAAAVLQTPDRLRKLVAAGRTEEAEKAWERPRQLLEAWKEHGVGGDDVAACLADGAAALRGEPSPAGRSVQPAGER